MFDVFIFRDIVIPSLEDKRRFVCFVCLITVEQDCVACICEGVLEADANSNADLDMAQTILRGKLFVQEKSIWTTKNVRRDRRACS